MTTNETAVDDIVALLPPLMHVIEALGFVARHFNLDDFGAVLDAVGAPDAALKEVRPRLDTWPASLQHICHALQAASDAALAGFAALRTASASSDPVATARRGLRQTPRAMEALYPLAARFPPISQFFVTPERRQDESLLARLDQPPRENETGIIHFNNETAERGGFSVYVPEYYTAERDWPVVFALHGGSGHGRAFLWNWLRDARSQGAILVAPTALNATWALMGDDVDTPNLQRMLTFVEGRWRIDAAKRLMTGMSDGGTFCYVSGLDATSPFTHLAPVSASFHPLLAQFAEADRIRGLPIHLVHGEQDWMFPVQVARHAETTLTLAGADVTYREIADLSHCYPTEINGEILAWLGR